MAMHAPRRTEDQTRRVRDLLRASIVAGDYPSDVLPSEEALRTEFGAPRACIRDALTQLQDEGLVHRVRGQGTFISGDRVWHSMRELHGVADPDDDSALLAPMVTEVVDWSTVLAVPPVARLLGIDTDDPVLRIDYIAQIDGATIGYATNYLAAPEADLVAPEMMQNDFYGLLTRAGIAVGRSTFHIETSLADEQDVQVLDVVVGEPVMVLEEVVYDLDNRPFDVAFCRAQRQTALFSREGLPTVPEDPSRGAESMTARPYGGGRPALDRSESAYRQHVRRIHA